MGLAPRPAPGWPWCWRHACTAYPGGGFALGATALAGQARVGAGVDLVNAVVAEVAGKCRSQDVGGKIAEGVRGVRNVLLQLRALGTGVHGRHAISHGQQYIPQWE